MRTMTALISRNRKLFFRDRGMFLSSLITPVILIVLYATFLANVYKDSFLSALPDTVQISDKLINGTVAAQLAAAAEAAIRARAQIHSPSRVTDKLGNYFGIGWVNGIMDHVQEARQAAMELIQVPELTPAPEIGMSLRSGYEDLNDDSYQYSSNGKYTIYVPVNLDGREIGKATATYTREEIEKQETRENRKKGRRINV